MIDIHPEIIKVVFIIFIVSIFLFNKILYKPILKFMSDRDFLINTNFTEAEKNNLELEQITEKNKKDILDAYAKAVEIKQKAKKEASEKISNALNAERNILDKDYNKFQTLLKKDMDSLKKDLDKDAKSVQTMFVNKLRSLG